MKIGQNEVGTTQASPCLLRLNQLLQAGEGQRCARAEHWNPEPPFPPGQPAGERVAAAWPIAKWKKAFREDLLMWHKQKSVTLLTGASDES